MTLQDLAAETGACCVWGTRHNLERVAIHLSDYEPPNQFKELLPGYVASVL